MVKRDEIDLKQETDKLYLIIRNGQRIGVLADISHSGDDPKWASRGAMSGFVYGSGGETGYPTKEDALSKFLNTWYIYWAKAQNLKVVKPKAPYSNL
jgi:hypothetical protein